MRGIISPVARTAVPAMGKFNAIVLWSQLCVLRMHIVSPMARASSSVFVQLASMATSVYVRAPSHSSCSLEFWALPRFASPSCSGGPSSAKSELPEPGLPVERKKHNPLRGGHRPGVPCTASSALDPRGREVGGGEESFPTGALAGSRSGSKSEVFVKEGGS